ncbi:hypothetical protein CRI93_06075 [Longimonas halophila]|uniref:Serine hydrolase n=1 Tax=Longimonas halophila TaxID=1469170 RepID=A0A2H3NYX2_9BACT|nr:serine hydrolase [Longimonas halophila]PEN08007.1 hypothetical protein CRI93_06075 [Longimonas halophila]
MSRSRLGCGTHLLIAFGLFVVAVGIIAYQNRDTVSMMWANVTAMNEGMDLTEELRYPEDVLDYMEAHPETVSLVAYTVGAEAEGIHLDAETARPLVNLPSLAVLSAYAKAAAAGQVDTTARVPVAEVSSRSLPGVNAQPHERTLNRWSETNRIDADSTVAVADIAWAVARLNDDPALDWLIDRLGRAAIRAETEALGWPAGSAPMPKSGLYLEWANAASALHSDADRAPSIEQSAIYAAAERYASDSTYAREIRQTFQSRGTNLTLRDQRRMAQETLPQATATEVAAAMVQMAEAAPESSYATAYALLDRSTGLDSLNTHVQRVASKGGAMPGVISFAGLAHYADDRAPRVVVLSMEEIPLAVFYHLLQSGLDQGLALRLLSDDAFFEETRTRIQASNNADPTDSTGAMAQ